MFVTQFIVNSIYWSEAMYIDDAKRNESNIEAMYRSVVKKRCWETIEKRWKRWNGFENWETNNEVETTIRLVRKLLQT